MTIWEKTTDKYGRTVGDVILPDGTNLNHEFVRAGFAWWYRQYASGDRTLEALEAEARKAKRGLWADKSPIQPWEWRRVVRSGSPKVEPGEVKPGAMSYHGNRSSRIFHKLVCRYYDCKNCTAIFKSRDESISAGYRPCIP